jgi:hypothetical protein
MVVGSSQLRHSAGLVDWIACNRNLAGLIYLGDVG